eukprot:1395031-Amorphochlora_amoeboformis.AAC.5
METLGIALNIFVPCSDRVPSCIPRKDVLGSISAHPMGGRGDYHTVVEEVAILNVFILVLREERREVHPT